jgi:hypothetical protein
MGVVSILEFDVEACLESSTLGGYPGRCMRSPLVRKFRTRRPARSSNAGGHQEMGLRRDVSISSNGKYASRTHRIGAVDVAYSSVLGSR